MGKRVRQYFIIGNVDSRKYGIDVRGIDGFDGAERDVTTVSIPGRNGSLTIDNGGYKDVSYKYECIMCNRDSAIDFDTEFASFRDAVLSLQGANVEIHDSYHPSEYVIGRVDGVLSPNVTEDWQGAKYAKFDVKITRKPQRYIQTTAGQYDHVTLKAGAAETITNPTHQTAYPAISISGTGQLCVGDCYVTVNTNHSGIILNCETQEATGVNGENYNGYITLDTGGFPTLKPGNTKVIVPSSMSLVLISTKFWRL